jgi:CobQ-like glutamine amidotransferase family enzyme
MTIYADRGKLLLLEYRCAWPGAGFSLWGAGLGEPLDLDAADLHHLDAADLHHLGGGQRDQRVCAYDLAEQKGDALHEIAAKGRLALAIRGGYVRPPWFSKSARTGCSRIPSSRTSIATVPISRSPEARRAAGL